MKDLNNSDQSHRDAPKKLIIHLPKENLDGRNFRDLLSLNDCACKSQDKEEKRVAHLEELGRERDKRKWRTLDLFCPSSLSIAWEDSCRPNRHTLEDKDTLRDTLWACARMLTSTQLSWCTKQKFNLPHNRFRTRVTRRVLRGEAAEQLEECVSCSTLSRVEMSN
jgi:hypothetical protein